MKAVPRELSDSEYPHDLNDWVLSYFERKKGKCSNLAIEPLEFEKTMNMSDSEYLLKKQDQIQVL